MERNLLPGKIFRDFLFGQEVHKTRDACLAWHARSSKMEREL